MATTLPAEILWFPLYQRERPSRRTVVTTASQLLKTTRTITSRAEPPPPRSTAPTTPPSGAMIRARRHSTGLRPALPRQETVFFKVVVRVQSPVHLDRSLWLAKSPIGVLAFWLLGATEIRSRFHHRILNIFLRTSPRSIMSIASPFIKPCT
jgi:hypothetical protein